MGTIDLSWKDDFEKAFLTAKMPSALSGCAFRPRRTADPVMTDSIGAKRRKPVD